MENLFLKYYLKINNSLSKLKLRKGYDLMTILLVVAITACGLVLFFKVFKGGMDTWGGTLTKVVSN